MSGRSFKRELFGCSDEDHDSVTSPSDLIEQKSRGRNVGGVEMGEFDMETVFYSPIPEDENFVDKLYTCEFCLCFMKQLATYNRHRRSCKLRNPPGIEIFRSGSSVVFEVDGKKARIFCQNLCILTKFFLEHKTTCYDVSGFMFYVLCNVERKGCQIRGFFSKEKASDDHVLSCILVLPPFRRKGCGRLMISMAYELMKGEGRVGTPERPLTMLGAKSFRAYWSDVVQEFLLGCTGKRKVTIKMISKSTGLAPLDVVKALKDLGLVVVDRYGVKLVPLRHVVSKKLSTSRRQNGVNYTKMIQDGMLLGKGGAFAKKRSSKGIFKKRV